MATTTITAPMIVASTLRLSRSNRFDTSALVNRTGYTLPAFTHFGDVLLQQGLDLNSNSPPQKARTKATEGLSMEGLKESTATVAAPRATKYSMTPVMPPPTIVAA